MKKILLKISILFISLSLWAVEIPFTKKAPCIDGAISKGEWNSACKLELTNSTTGAKPVNPTQVKLLYDKDNLYILYVCTDNSMDKLRAEWKFAEEHDSRIWKDDCIELFFDPQSSGKVFPFHFIVNSNGVTYDARENNKLWNSNIKVSASKSLKSWQVEIKIPFRNFGFSPLGGECWQCCFCRQKVSPKEYSCSKAGSKYFKDYSHAMEFSFASPAKNKFKLLSINKEHDNKVVFSGPAGYNCTVYSLDKLPNEVKEYKNKAVKNISTIDYIPVSNRIKIQVHNKSGKEIYSNILPIRYDKIKIAKRTRTISKPVYKELLSNTPPGLAQDGVMFWFHGSNEAAMRKFALQYGLPYSLENLMKEINKYRFRPIGSFYTINSRKEMSSKSGTKWLFCPTARYTKAPKMGIFPFLADPQAEKAYMKNLDKLREVKDNVWGVFIGDEMANYQQMIGIKFFNDKKMNYPFIKKADKEIKRLYGGDKYGIPLSKDDPNVFRWIAYRSWINDKMQAFMQRVYKKVKEIAPNMPVISEDPMALQSTVYDFSGFKKICDIATHQLYPTNNPDFAFSGFITKYLKDISGCKEIWPCVHVEEYAGSYTPQEVLDMFSEALRNGATGLHLYLCDTVGRRAKKKYLHTEFYGAPDRWQIETAVAKHLQKMNKINFPEADCAIFSPVMTARSYPGLMVSAKKNSVLHSFLGPHSGVWFKFINESTIRNSGLDKYKAIFVTDAKYTDINSLKRLIKYVSNGGKLIVFDPEAFQSTNLHEIPEHLRSKILGFKGLTKTKHNSINYKGIRLNVSNLKCYNFQHMNDVKVIASYEDKSPALISHKLGKGKVICFAANPNREIYLRNSIWKKFYSAFCSELGLKTGNKIWNFALPRNLIKAPALPSGKCYTNNAIAWRQFKPVTYFNTPIGGSYSYSPIPNAIKDQGGVKNIKFSKGDLTDRRDAPKAGNVDLGKSKLENWVVSWNTPKSISVDFRLKQNVPVNQVNIYYSGSLRNIKLKLSADGKNFQTFDFPVTPNDNKNLKDVRIKKLSLPQAIKAQYININFAKVTDKSPSKIILSEIEIWNK